MNEFFKEIVVCIKSLIYLLCAEIKGLFNKNMDNRN